MGPPRPGGCATSDTGSRAAKPPKRSWSGATRPTDAPCTDVQRTVAEVARACPEDCRGIVRHANRGVGDSVSLKSGTDCAHVARHPQWDAPMTPRSSGALSPSAFARGRPRRTQASHERRSLAPIVMSVALAWLLLGGFGLLWTIAFTADPRSMTIGLVVWVFCFVAPSTLATVVASELDEAEPGRRKRRDSGAASAHAGD